MPKSLYPIACVVLASGFSQRFGANKLLASFNGHPLVQHILSITNELFAQRVVVTRHAEIKKLCDEQCINALLHNEPYLSDTIRLGVNYILGTQEEKFSTHTCHIKPKLTEYPSILGLLFATGDQPLLSQNSIQKLCESFLAAPEKIHRLAAGSTPGNPVIFPSALTQELQQLPQDKGGSVLIKKYPELVINVPVQDKYELYDIDTKADLLNILQYSHCSK